MAENGIIEFRGKSKDKSEWIYGSLLQDDYGNSCIVCFVDHHEEWHDVESESVGQFIGRKGNKLTKIFDGDIITVNGHYPKLVKFIPERAAFCLANISDFKNQEWWDIWQQPHSSWWNEMEIEVIGNKIDNPELLEDK